MTTNVQTAPPTGSPNILKTFLKGIRCLVAIPLIPGAIYFMVFAGSWLVILILACITGIVMLFPTFVGFFGALMHLTSWSTIGGMWNWLWSWFASTTQLLWPNMSLSFICFIIPAIAFIILTKIIDNLSSIAHFVKKSIKFMLHQHR